MVYIKIIQHFKGKETVLSNFCGNLFVEKSLKTVNTG